MSVKFFIYFFVTIITIWSLDAVNINSVFKKNKITQARIFYFILALALIELVTNFIYNVFLTVY